MRSSHRELEKKIQKSPEWVELWENGRPSGTYKMRVRDSFDVRTMSVELSDSLSLLELNEYADDLFKTGRLGDSQLLICFSTFFYALICPSLCLFPCLTTTIFHVLSSFLSFSLSLSITLSVSLSLSLFLSLSLSLSFSPFFRLYLFLNTILHLFLCPCQSQHLFQRQEEITARAYKGGTKIPLAGSSEIHLSPKWKRDVHNHHWFVHRIIFIFFYFHWSVSL